MWLDRCVRFISFLDPGCIVDVDLAKDDVPALVLGLLLARNVLVLHWNARESVLLDDLLHVVLQKPIER